MDPEILLDQPHPTYQPQAIFAQSPLLPLEILVEIFLLSLPPIHHAQSSHKATLALVCRLWNSVIQSTPLLWSRISSADDIAYIRKSLLKSGNSPIDLYGVASEDLGRHRHRFNFLQEVNPHMKRWRRVELHAMGDMEHDPSVAVLPFLESIKLRSRYHLPVGDGYLSLLGNGGRRAPRLREISLCTTHLPRWNISFPPGLSKLEIWGVIGSGPSPSELFSILASCPNLVVLRLHDLYPQVESGGVDNQTNTPPIIGLAVLRELALDHDRESLTRDLLARLRIPEDCAISVICRIKSSLATSFLNPALSHHRENLQSAGKNQQLAIRATESGFCVIATPGRWDMELNFGGTSTIIDALEWFGIDTETCSDAGSYGEALPAGFMAPSPTPITLEFIDNFKPEFPFEYIDSILSLRCITLIKTAQLRSRMQAKLLSYLSEPHALDRHPIAWPELTGANGMETREANVIPFPCLRTIVLNGTEDYALIEAADFVQYRSQQETKTGALGRQTRLKRIKFVGKRRVNVLPSPETEEACRNLILEMLGAMDDEAEVFWRGKRTYKVQATK